MGTARCSLWLASPSGSKEVLASHFGEARGVAAHPTDPNAYASVGADAQLLLWRAGAPLPTLRCALPAGGRCVTYASDASLVAAGLDDGSVVLLRVPSGGGAGGGGGAGRGGSESLVLGSKGGGRALEDIKFAPGTTAAAGGLLACAGHERIIEVHRVIADARAPGGVRLSPLAACRGHSGTVTHLDWSSDGSLLMSNCTAKEALYWTAATGKQQPAGRAAAAVTWATYTCPHGFPAMGIWPDGADGSDVNAVHRSSDGPGRVSDTAGGAQPTPTSHSPRSSSRHRHAAPRRG